MRYAIFSLAILLFFSSCSSDSRSELAVFRTTEKSMQQSNQAISSSNQDMSRILYNRLTDPRTSVQSRVWQPKATKISELASSTIKYIETLKTQLIVTDKALQDDNSEAVTQFFIQKNKGNELYTKLNEFLSKILSVDERFNTEFENHKRNIYNYLDSGKNAAENFSKMFFRDVSAEGAFTILEKFKNDILNTENQIVSYCYYKTFPIDHSYHLFRAIVGQSSNYVKAGDNIELTAGIGAFSVDAKTKVTIDRKDIELNPDGVAIYKFKTPIKAGKYSKAIKIEYTKPDSTKEIKTINIEYTVINPQ